VAIEQLPINPAEAFSDVTKVVGREPILPVGVGVPLIASQLSSGLAQQVEAGQRAVAINVDEVVGVGNRVMPGDYVDVFLVMRKDGQEIEDSQARLLLPHLRVLAFGPLAINEGPQKQPENNGVTRKVDQAKTAVLAVPVEAVSQLAMAHQSGRLLLALRNPGDEAEPDRQTAGCRIAGGRQPQPDGRRTSRRVDGQPDGLGAQAGRCAAAAAGHCRGPHDGAQQYRQHWCRDHPRRKT